MSVSGLVGNGMVSEQHLEFLITPWGDFFGSKWHTPECFLGSLVREAEQQGMPSGVVDRLRYAMEGCELDFVEPTVTEVRRRSGSSYILHYELDDAQVDVSYANNSGKIEVYARLFLLDPRGEPILSDGENAPPTPYEGEMDQEDAGRVTAAAA